MSAPDSPDGSVPPQATVTAPMPAPTPPRGSTFRRFAGLWGFAFFLLVVAYLFRGVLIPFAFAIVLFAGFEVLQRRRVISRAGSVIGQWLPEIVPRFFSVATLAAGASSSG